MSQRLRKHTILAFAATMFSIHAVTPAAAQTPAADTMRVPGFGTVTLYVPKGPPGQVVLFLSGDGGWNLGVIPMAQRLRQEGALAIGIDIRAFTRNLEASSTCAYPGGALEELSRRVQARLKLPVYKRPIIVGYSSGATMAYAVIAASPPESFAGAVSLGFCPDIEIHAPLCQMRGLQATKMAKGVGYDLAPFPGSTVPWMVLQGEQDQVCAPAQTRAFVTATGATKLFSLPKVGHGFGVPANWQPDYVRAYREIASAAASREAVRVTAPRVADLSLVEVPAAPGGITDTMAVIISGDGGWAGLDQAAAAGLAARGIPVVGWSSLDYYWSPRTPEHASADLARIVSHYTDAWQRPRVLVVGYSFGADVAPFLVNRLPDSVTAHVSKLALLAPSDAASFEFHLTDWISAPSAAGRPMRPELDRLSVPTLCLSPADEPAAACATSNSRVTRLAAPAGHHFGGHYDWLVKMIVK